MDALSIQYVIIITVVILGGFSLFFRIRYKNDNRLRTLLLSNFRENSTYEVLAFAVEEDGSDNHMMFLKNMDKSADYPLAAVSGRYLAHLWCIGDIVTTNEKKELCKLPF